MVNFLNTKKNQETGYFILHTLYEIFIGGFTIPSEVEVVNYLIWRQQDTVRNSISSVAQSEFSPKQLHGVKTNGMQEMLFQERGINWNDFDPKLKRGRMIVKEQYQKGDALRNRWVSEAPPTFTAFGGKEYLLTKIKTEQN